MKASLRLLASASLALLAPLAAAADGPGWMDDYDEAAALAREQGKDLLVDFTGSDWCGWCIKLKDEVYGHQEFIDAASKSFVLVALDFPRGDEAKAKVPNPERNEELRDKHDIRGFPTVLLMSAEGDVYASTGYRPGGVEPYLEHLDQLRASGRKALVETKEIVTAFEQAETPELKRAACERALELLGTLDGDSPFAGQLAGPARYALTADPKNESGLKLRAVKALLLSGQADEEIRTAARELDPKNAEGLLEAVVQAQFQEVKDDATARAALTALDELVQHGFKQKQLGFELNLQAAAWCNGPLQDAERAKQYALAAKAIGSDDERAMEFLESILNG